MSGPGAPDSEGIESGRSMDPDRPLVIIVAMAKDRVIGNNGGIPWHIPEDLKTLKRLTMGGAVIMGRATWESIGKPLPGRINLVVSTSMVPTEGVVVCRNVAEAMERGRETGRKLFCLGGASVYRQCLPLTSRMYVSLVEGTFEGDTFFPEIEPSEWRLTESEPHEGYSLLVYDRV